MKTLHKAITKLSIVLLAASVPAVAQSQSRPSAQTRPEAKAQSRPAGAPVGLAIQNVSNHPTHFDPTAGGKGTIQYRLSAPARITVRIWDGSDRLVRTLVSDEARVAGEQREVWDGHDDRGRVVPDEAYFYTIEARRDEDGEPVVYDITDLDRGRDTFLDEEALQFDKVTGEIRYVLQGPSRVGLRVILGDPGPLIRTLVDWEPRHEQLNELTWDGWDASEATNFLGKIDSDLRVVGIVYRFPRNTFVTTGRGDGVRRITDLPDVRRERGEQQHLMWHHFQHTSDRCYDPPIRLQLAEGPGYTAVTPNAVAVQVTAAPEVERVITDQRAEMVFYVDGVFAYEEELGYLPFTWIWNPHGLAGTSHVIQVTLRGYEGHWGAASLAVELPAAASAAGSSAP